MRKVTRIGFYAAVVILALSLFACGNKSGAWYGNGNGAILSVEKAEGKTMTFRRHEQDVKCGDGGPDVYADHSMETLVGNLRANETVHISQVCVIDFDDDDYPQSRCQITNGRISGWIFVPGPDSYHDDKWSIVETISSGGKTWTVRKYEGVLSVWESKDVRNKPGMDGTEVVFSIEPPADRMPLTFNILAMTEEMDNIDGKEDHWLKIDYNGKTGWLWGGDVSVERGGQKYHTPEANIAFYLERYRNSIDTLLDRVEREIEAAESLVEQDLSYEEIVLGLTEIRENMEYIITEIDENYDYDDVSADQDERIFALSERLKDLDAQYGVFFD